MIPYLIPGLDILSEQILAPTVTHNPAHLRATELCDFTGTCQVFIIIFPGIRRVKIFKLSTELLHSGTAVKR